MAVVIGKTEANPETTIELGRELTLAEYDEYEKADDWLSRLVEYREKIALLREEYVAYKSHVDGYADEYKSMQTASSVFEFHNRQTRAYHRANTRLRSLLSEISTFLNYAEGFLKRQYGKDSDQAKRFKAATSREYDASPSYRFIYQLRNYALHFDVPISHMTYRDGPINPITGTDTPHVLVEIDKDKLLSSGFDWKKVRRDIESFSDKFALNPHLDAMISALERINTAIIVEMLPDLKRSARYIERLSEPLRQALVGRRGTPTIVHWESPENAKVGKKIQMNFRTEVMPVDLALWVLRETNSQR